MNDWNFNGSYDVFDMNMDCNFMYGEGGLLSDQNHCGGTWRCSKPYPPKKQLSPEELEARFEKIDTGLLAIRFLIAAGLGIFIISGIEGMLYRGFDSFWDMIEGIFSVLVLGAIDAQLFIGGFKEGKKEKEEVSCEDN